jgi:uncharacterized protein (TIGR02246 family)
MKSTAWRRIVVVGFLILGGAGVTQIKTRGATDSPDKEKAVELRLAEIQDAAQNLDPDKLFSFVLENNNGAVVQDGQVLLTRDAALKSTRQGFKGLRKVSYRFDQQHITLLSPTVALAVGEGVSSAATEDGRDFSARFAQSVVLVESDGEWKVFHAHRSFPPSK